MKTSVAILLAALLVSWNWAAVPGRTEDQAPDAIDLRPAFLGHGFEPRDQGKRDTCSLFAITALAEFELAEFQLARSRDAESGAKSKGAELKGAAGSPARPVAARDKATADAKAPSTPADRLSTEYVIWAANEATGLEGDQGMFYEAIRGLQRLGVCRQDLMPYRLDAAAEPSAPSTAAAADASTRTHWREHWIKRWDIHAGLTAEQLRRTREELAGGHPVAVGLRWPTAPQLSDEHVLATPPADAVFDGHSVLFVGYRDDAAAPGGGTFLLRNSAGSSWGDGGHAWMTYDYVQRYANDAVTLRAVSAPGPRQQPLEFEAEDLTVVMKVAGEVVRQSMEPWGAGLWGGGKQVFFRPADVGAGPAASDPAAAPAVGLEFRLRRSGRYRIEVDATCAPDFGVMQVLFDGKPIGAAIDLYGGRVYPRRHIVLDTRRLRTGLHRLRFVVTGRNDRSSGRILGIDTIRLVPVP